MADKVHLSLEPARELTSRECANMIGATLGGLAQMTSIQTVREAFDWWAQNREAWDLLERVTKAFNTKQG